ncbi:hypothetical protein [Nitrosovibrio tenuis]|uniref:Uncharacterized protein n=1 Tax=Nitrosovibrio tenuis TaxID=1233 RepID=A0A1H7MDP8_9PROT|nr:hypothetical protein [Nitrosovibrio tenuis]SEL09302.1 hypothetical protein SAMN05216387_10537 [Nitrosovibrio tenuis]
MFGSSILEVAIGVIFVYLLLSLICTAINEAIASLLQKRGKNLFEGIKNLLNDPTFTGLAQQLYNHGLISSISQHAVDPNKPTRKPSYMSPENFSLALLDILGIRGVIAARYGDLLAQAEKADDAYETARQAAAAMPGNSQLAQAAELARQAQAQARAALETIADKAKAAYEAALQAANQADGNTELAAAATDAKMKADQINATLKMLDARRAAIASAKNPREAALLLNAGATLREALEFGRTIAAQYPDPLGNIQEGLKRLPEGNTKESLLVLVDKTRREVKAIEHQAEAFRKNLEGWFNDAMNRVGGWYKRWTQQVLFGLAIIVVVASNADTVMLIQRLSQDNALRASLVAAAQDAVKSQPSPKSAESASPGAIPAGESEDTRIQFVLEKARNLQLPVGWSGNPTDPGYFQPPRLSLEFASWALYKLFGLAISIFAVSLGAPFWFDTLSKFVNVRSAGTPPGETKKSAPQPT